MCNILVFKKLRPPSLNFMYRKKNKDTSPHKVMEKEIRSELKDHKLPIITNKIRLVIFFELKGKREVDIDNMARGIINCLQGILYKNDNQIYELFLKKKLNCIEDQITVKWDIYEPIEEEPVEGIVDEQPQVGELF